MFEFFQMVSDWFDTILKIITSFLESIGAFVTALTHISIGLSESVVYFPTFIGSIMLACFALLVLLRIVGR